jgi:hypothetical protein
MKIMCAENCDSAINYPLIPRQGDRGSTVIKVLCYSGTAVAQWLKCCATVGPR